MKKRGFTLAEVLIAMGVIGVIAAMTIPALMTNYREKEWEAKLKKTFSIATTACERMLVEENVAHADETALYSQPSNADTIRRYFKVLRTPTTTAATGTTGASAAFFLPDGVQLTVSQNTANNGFNFAVDLNGPQGTNDNSGGPDQAYRDQYAFVLNRDCTYVSTSTTTAHSAFQAVVNNNWRLVEAPSPSPTTSP